MDEHLHVHLLELQASNQRIERALGSIMRKLSIINLKENIQMAEFAKLNEDVAKLTDISESFKTMVTGLNDSLAAITAERDALKAADALDDAAIAKADADIAAITATLEALKAVIANTPASGGSTGGIQG